MTAILGLSAYFHDSAAALVVDGEIVAAAQEERFSRIKHDSAFPRDAVAFCLNHAGLKLADLDYVVFYEKPLSKFERLIETYMAVAPRGFLGFRSAVPIWLNQKLDLRKTLRRELASLGEGKPRLVFPEHHESHAASAFFPSPFETAAILTIDGVGEWATTTSGYGEGNLIHLDREIRFPHSLGLLYSAFTTYCGFKIHSGEYKLMGLAPFGKPVYSDLILERLIDLKPDGSFRLDLDYFGFLDGLRMTNHRFHDLFGRAPREPESNIETIHMDLAASIQAVTEQVVLRLASDLHRRTGLDNLVMAGGVALNCVANGRLVREGPFKKVWVQPAAGDAGGSLGAALFVWHQLLKNPRRVSATDTQRGSFLGPESSTLEVRRFLVSKGVAFETFEDEDARLDRVARLLADGAIVAVYQGRMEFGPRALGARSILGDARSPLMQSRMNLKIKFRESFRPFAPCVLAEHANEWFELGEGVESPYMLLTAKVREEHRRMLNVEEQRLMEDDPDLCRRVGVVRSTIPAVTHLDDSARIQTVDESRNPGLYKLLRAFHRLTGVPILVNTSFNVRGEPIVGSLDDAYRCFQFTEIDAIMLEDVLIFKDLQESESGREAAREHLAKFALD